jgi:beta-glucosidase-like glycosyl hydrolase
MGAVANKYQPGVLDAMAFKAGNDIMLFSQDVATGKKLIQQAIDKGEISQQRVEESVKKILLTKYFLGLKQYTPKNSVNITTDINNNSHKTLVQNLYSNAITLIKDKKDLLPIAQKETVYYVPLEEAPYQTFANKLSENFNVIIKKASEIKSIPNHSKVLVGFHKDNSSAYKPFKISEASKQVLNNLTKKNKVVLSVFGSPYALRDINLDKISTVLVAYENNEDSMNATAEALAGKTTIHGRLPVLVNEKLPAGMGIDLEKK